MICPCNVLTEVGSGGGKLGGSAVVSVDAREGGVRAGGCALVEVRPDPWDGMVFVLPLNEDVGLFLDRTKNHLDGTAGLRPTTDSGVFCQPSQYFDGRDYIFLPADGLRNEFTVSLWVKLESKYRERTWYSRGGFSIGNSYINHVWARLGETSVFSSATLPIGKWFYVAASWDGSTLRVFVNGQPDGSGDGDILANSTGGLLGRGHAGNLQEVRLHPVARNEDWLTAEYSNFCTGEFVQQGEVIGATLGDG